MVLGIMQTLKNSFKNISLFGCLLVIAMTLASCAKEKKKEDLTFKELSDRVSTSLKKNKRDEAINYLEEIIGRFPDHQQISQYKMMLAELYFKSKKYPAAQELYESFNTFYPADKKAEYSKYKSIYAMFNQTLSIDCDQTETEETVRLCKEYLQNNTYSKYRKKIAEIQHVCENKLIDKEAYIFNFYLHQGKKDAARNRLKFMKEKYLANYPNIEPRLLYLESKLAQREKHKDIVKQNTEKLLEKYPNSQYTQMAQSLTTKRAFIF